ncbi:translation initiation factor IF-2 subunit beta [Halobacteriaceae archaeon GCM10025711]
MDYDDHLERALSETPDTDATGERFDVPAAEVRKEGNVTVYENFQATLDRLARDERHVLKFLQNEVGTSAQIDESGRARLTGEFGQDRIQDALDEYVDTYVLCPECGLPDTRLEREEDVLLLRCEACGARSSVPQ